MNNKNLLRRIEHIEGLLENESSPGKLSPVLQEAVDRILKRLAPYAKAGEEKTETGEGDNGTGK